MKSLRDKFCRVVNWTYARQESASRFKNSPFDGWRMKGRAVVTIVAGKVVEK